MAVPMQQSNDQPVFEVGPDGTGSFGWMSHVTDSIFGQDATDYDYQLISNVSGAAESMQAFAAAYSTGSEKDILVSFLNATMFGEMTEEQAADQQWLCQELEDDMAAAVNSCKDIPRPVSESEDLEKTAPRPVGRYGWIRSGIAVSGEFAMEVLKADMSKKFKDHFNNNPRSYCDVVNSVRACFSYSKAENFNYNYAVGLLDDALHYVDFNKYSCLAKNAIGRKKRTGAVACFSNRPTGCHAK